MQKNSVRSPSLAKIILIMVICGFAVGLFVGLVQVAFDVRFPGGAAVGAAVGTVGGLLLGRRATRTPPDEKIQ